MLTTMSAPDVAARTWTVGVDGSDDASAALRWAAGFAGQTGGRVVPLTAWHLPLSIKLASTKRVLEVDRNGLRAEAEVLVADVVEQLGLTDAVAEPMVIESDAATALLERAEAGDQIVVGRRGVSDLRHRLLGSVSTSVATHARGPVVVVPRDWTHRQCRRIVVGFDGSEYAQSAVRWALDVAPDDAVVEALIAVDVIPWLRPELVASRYPDELVAAEERIGAALHDVDPDGRLERHEVVHGPRQAFADAFGSADLVVVGPRGLGGAARAVLGSLTTWLLHDAPCPVAVVPTPGG